MTIAIYFDRPGKMDYPFNNAGYYEAYAAFAKLCEEKGTHLYIVRGADSYKGNMQFVSGYQFEDSDLVFIDKPFTADMIYVKGYNLPIGKDDRTLNHPDVTTICHNKFTTYQTFHEYMSPTFEITQSNYSEVLKNIQTEKVVLKPIFGSEGKGIHIVEKKDVTPHLFSPNTRYFVQQFIDSSKGIPGIVEGLHDLRLTVFNGNVRHTYIRQPKKGSYLANIAQGGSFIFAPIEKIPQSAFDLAAKIDTKFKQYSPRLYAIDLMYEGEKPYLVELNDQPGLPYLDEGKEYNYQQLFLENLYETLATASVL